MAPYQGIGGSRTGIGANFARSRLLLARRAGYLPQDFAINPQAAPEQWRMASRNLARDARGAGFQNPLMYLRQGATAGGRIPRPTAMRPGAAADPSASLAYVNSRLAQGGVGIPQMGPTGLQWGGVQLSQPQPPNQFAMQAQQRLPSLPAVSRRGRGGSTII